MAMLEFARWKYVVAAVVIGLSVLYALPNVFPQDPSVQVTANRSEAVDETLVARVQGILDEAGVAAKSVAIESGDDLLVRLSSADEQVRASDALRAGLGSGYVVALNLASTVPDWLAAVGGKPMLLGLDLQGGVHFLMQIDRAAALDKHFESYVEDLRATLREGRVRYRSVERDGNDIVATLAPGQDMDKALGLAAAQMPLLRTDVDGQVLTLTVPDSELQDLTANAIDQNLGTLRNRISELGVAEPIVQKQGSDRIVVQLPGVQDTAQAKRIIGATATLEYRAVVEGNAFEAVRTGNIPPQARVYHRRETGPNGEPIPVLLNKRIIASGEHLQDASSFFDSQSGTPAVRVQLSSVGGQRMFEFSSVNVGKPMAVVYIERVPTVRMVDGEEVRTTRTEEEVISVATVQSALGRNFQTTGLESMKEAADLALLLRAGSLAAPMDIVEERIIGPSLGQENVERGMAAVTYSFCFALLFFLVYYRMFGIITCLALLLNLLMVVALMSLMGFTLTLPGLAGIALTVGMSVDANVLINERIREELRTGMPPKAAIGTGYERASGTIADANLTALLAGLALFAFGTGPVQGFAVALILGIVTSMYTAVSVSHGIAALIYGRRRKLKTVAI